MSLRRISLQDFILMDTLEIDFHSGFTVLTGETGAGKSMVIDALQMVLGERANSRLVREGKERCDISAEFDSHQDTEQWLRENGFRTDESLLLRRQIDKEGKSRGWINGTPATATQLRTLGGFLLDIYGQHAWQSLIQMATTRALLDAYGNIQTKSMTSLWERWQQTKKQLELAKGEQSQIQDQRERLVWNITEVEKLTPHPSEWEELNKRHQRLSHAKNLIASAQQALATLNDDHTNAYDLLQKSIDLLQTQTAIEPDFNPWVEGLHQAQTYIQECIHGLQHYLHQSEVDDDALQSLDERLSLWLSLSRRFHCLPEHLTTCLESWKKELAELDIQTDIQYLEAQVTEYKSAFIEQAKTISTQRQKTALTLSAQITRILQELGMEGGSLKVDLKALAEPSMYGLERIEFLVAGHRGTQPKPLSQVASGGELSRIALAIAVSTSRLGNTPTLIFDEVDTGIGGAVAQSVGRLMRQLGQDRQVIAVTHLAQVAAKADHHLRVSKYTQNQQTYAQVHILNNPQRTREIARMLAGEDLTEASLTHAQELIENKA
jgi:DNA repair protein RecN (Recombination protein N)